MKFSLVTFLGISLLTFAGCTSAEKANTNTNAAPAANKTAETPKPAETKTDSSSGDVVTIDEAGITMTIPQGFKFSKDGDDTVVMTEDEGVDVRFTVPKDGDYEKVVGDAAAELDSYLKDIQIVDKGSKTTVNGMEATSMSGSAKDEDGEEVMWELTVINAPKKPVLANVYAEKASLEKHMADVKKFFESIKKQ